MAARHQWSLFKIKSPLNTFLLTVRPKRYAYIIMKFFLLFMFFSYSLIADSDNLEVEQYLIETSFYKDIITEIVGIYLINELPPRIHEDIIEQTKLLKQYLFLKENPNAFKSRRGLTKAELLDRINQIKNKNLRNSYPKYRSLFSDMLKLENKLLNIDFEETHSQTLNYLKDLEKEFDFLKNKYSRNNKLGLEFLQNFQTNDYEPLLEYFDNYMNYEDYVKGKSGKQDFRTISINRLSMDEYKLRWNYFKEKKYDFLNTYFQSKRDSLKVLDEQNSFTVTYDLSAWDGNPYFVLHVKMLKHDWYVIMSSDYQTSRHEFSLIKI